MVGKAEKNNQNTIPTLLYESSEVEKEKKNFPCECQQSWRYEGDTYIGCDPRAPDWNSPWCYVNDGEKCNEDLEESSVRKNVFYRRCSLSENDTKCEGEWTAAEECDQKCGDKTVVEKYTVTRGSKGKCKQSDRTVECPSKPPCTSCSGEWFAHETYKGENNTCNNLCGDNTFVEEFIVEPGTDPVCDLQYKTRTVECPTKPSCTSCSGKWTSNLLCDNTCGTKSIEETYNTLNEGTDGSVCPHKDGETRGRECPVKPPCVKCLGKWKDGTCQQLCGDETRIDTFHVTQEATDGSDCKNKDKETREVPCKHVACTSCDAAWEKGKCAKTCGDEVRIDTYRVKEPPNDGTTCPHENGTTREVSCDHRPCIQCKGEWKTDETCDQICGNKFITEAFRVLEQGDTPCEQNEGDTRIIDCPAKPPCAKCRGGWTKGACNDTCGDETRVDTYNITQPPTDGSLCESEEGETREVSCDHPACIDCNGGWENTRACTKTCGADTSTSTYKITQPGKGGEKACPHQDGETKTVSCDLPECIGCSGKWFGEETCDQLCGEKTVQETFQNIEQGNDGSKCEANDGDKRDKKCPSKPECKKCDGAWAETKSCSQTCGDEEKVETYTVREKATDGTPCKHKDGAVRTSSCDNPACTSCAGSWTNTSQCSKSCGPESYTMAYNVTEKGNNGSQCEAEDGETKQVDCQHEGCLSCAGQWVQKGKCDQPCGTKTIEEMFKITQPGNDGTECPHNDGFTRPYQCPEPVQCLTCEGDWQTTEECTKTCGKGNKIETYKVTQTPTDGSTCSILDGTTRTTACNLPECVDCKGGWDQTTACSKRCGPEQRVETYTVVEKGNRAPCPQVNGETRNMDCDNPGCTPCQGEWTTDETCDQACGEKSVQETFRVTAQGNDGSTCEAKNGETRQKKCPGKPACKICQGKWTMQNQCSQVCGPETQKEVYKVTQHPTDGSTCPIEDGTIKETECANPVCVDCKGGWDQTTACSKPCGPEQRVETYKVLEKGNRTQCPHSDGETRKIECENPGCTPCQGEWTTDETCDQLCGEKTILETFRVTAQGNDGSTCEAKNGETRQKKCPGKPACKICQGKWTMQNQCSQVCGPETQKEVYKVTQHPTDGSTCPIEDGTIKETECANPVCVDCKGEWDQTTACSKRCGPEQRVETYEVVEKGNRALCPHRDGETRNIECNNPGCTPCQGEWTTDETCDQACGEKTILETFKVTQQSNDGSMCEAKHYEKRKKKCPGKPVCTICQGKWTIQKQCSQVCGPEKQKEVYEVTQQPTDGSICPIEDGTTKETDCNLPECVDCKGEWDQTTACSKRCGPEQRVETYEVVEKGNRALCPHRDGETRNIECNNPGCTPCQGEWTTDETCDQACGEKTILETFKVTQQSNDGSTCEAADKATREKMCPSKPACKKCQGIWLKAPCKKACGPENQIENFKVLEGATDGSSCEHEHGTVRMSECNNPTCVDCVGVWTPTTQCEKSCGNEDRVETYEITTPSKGGVACPFEDGDTRKVKCENPECTPCQGEWTTDETCDRACGEKTILETFKVTQQSNDGSTCEAADKATREKTCRPSKPACKKCQGIWLKTPCKKTCGPEQQPEVYKIIQHSTDNTACEYKDGTAREIKCNHPECVDCRGEWTTAQTCGCGTPFTTEVYTVTRPGNGGEACPANDGDTRTKECPKEACQHCAGEWVHGTCDRDCGDGNRTDTFKITAKAFGTGNSCEVEDGATRSVRCNIRECKRCIGEWKKQDICDHLCGEKSVEETFRATREGEGEYKCPANETRTVACAPKKECQGCMGEWVTTKECTKICGPEDTVETFRVTQEPTDGSTCLYEDGETRRTSCGHKTCQQCTGDWKFGSCTQACGPETRTDVFRIAQTPTDGSICSFPDGHTRESSCSNPKCTPCTGAWRNEGETCNHTCGTKQVKETYRVVIGGNDGSVCPHKDGDERIADCPVKEVCGTCQGYWERGSCTEPCGEEIRKDVFKLTKKSTDGSACPYKNGEIRELSCNNQPCLKCKGDWVSQPCTKSCGKETVKQTYRVIHKGNDGLSCPFSDGEEKDFECKLPSCLVKLKQDVCHPYDTICRQIASNSEFCTKLDIANNKCTEDSIMETIGQKCIEYNIFDDCNYTSVATEMYKKKEENQIDQNSIDITMEKEELKATQKKLKRREEKIVKELSKVQNENHALRNQILTVQQQLQEQQQELRDRENMLARREKRLVRQANKQDRQQSIEDDAWEMFRDFESKKADMIQFVENNLAEKPYLENLCALTSGRNIPRYECTEMINKVGQTCSKSCLAEYGGSFDSTECKQAVPEFNDLKVTCQLFSAIFAPDKMSKQDLDNAIRDPLYSEVHHILSIDTDKPVVVEEIIKTTKTETFVCGNPDLDSEVCTEFGAAYEFPTIYKNGICEMTAIDNKDDCDEFGAEAEGFNWTQLAYV